MSKTAKAKWESKRTAETREVERVLRDAGFEQADAYRYNSASIRVRVIDSKFEGLDRVKRDAQVEKVLGKLPERTQGDIVMLLTFAPAELDDPQHSPREYVLNREFEDPSPSKL